MTVCRLVPTYATWWAHLFAAWAGVLCKVKSWKSEVTMNGVQTTRIINAREAHIALLAIIAVGAALTFGCKPAASQPTAGAGAPSRSTTDPTPPVEFNKELEPLVLKKMDDDKRYEWTAGATDIPPVSAEKNHVVIHLETTKFGNGYHVIFGRKAGAWAVPGAISNHPGVPQPGDGESAYDWSETALDEGHQYLVAPDPDGSDPLIVDIMPAAGDPEPGFGAKRELHVVRVIASK
jgi:hypothetical protein